MPRGTSLAKLIEKQLPAGLVNFLWLAGELAHTRGERLYLVGGAVRDLLLGKTNLDLDLAVEGNAIELAGRLRETNQATLTTHTRFSTARLSWESYTVDLATARRETYERPGALPSVTPSTIDQDLYRRDFTINAMAVHLNPGEYGRLLDPFGGRSDLKNKIIRVLHEKSFVDDATRIWRGLRYEQRLDFHLERQTLRLLQRDRDMLDTISPDRTRYEIECVLKEAYPERVFRRAGELGVLARLHPSLKGNGWLAARFEQARRTAAPQPPGFEVYLALLAYPLSGEEVEAFITHLNLPKTATQTLRDTIALKDKIRLVATPGISASSLYRLLEGHSPTAIAINSLATESPVAQQNMRLFLNKLRYIRVSLSGEDLIGMGVARGPQIREVLSELQKAKLNGQVITRQDEERLVGEWLANS